MLETIEPGPPAAHVPPTLDKPGTIANHPYLQRRSLFLQNPGGDPPVMSASQVLQHLYSLDTSSPDLLRVLYGLILHDEGEQYSSGLEGAELARLVDFLDDVRPLILAPCPVINHIPQALGTIPTTDDVFRQCLRKLRAICGYHTTLPSSHIICGDLAKIGESPIACGGFADVWQGTHGGTGVCIKVLRISSNDHVSLRKVRVWGQRIFSLLLKIVLWAL